VLRLPLGGIGHFCICIGPTKHSLDREFFLVMKIRHLVTLLVLVVAAAFAGDVIKDILRTHTGR
jgi:hypothetical protein